MSKTNSMVVAVLFSMVVSLSITAYQRNVMWLNDELLWKDAIAKAPGKSRPYYRLGLYYRSSARNDQAIAWYQEALRGKLLDLKIYFDLGAAYHDMGNYAKEIETYRIALMALKTGELSDQYKGFLYSKIGDALLLAGNWVEARKAYYFALAINSMDDNAHFMLGFMLYSADKNYSLAANHLKTAIHINPSIPGYYCQLGEVYLAAKTYEDAVNELTQCLKYLPNDTKAIELYQKAQKGILSRRNAISR